MSSARGIAQSVVLRQIKTDGSLPSVFLKSPLQLELALDVNSLDRAHLVTTKAGDALVELDDRLAVLDVNGMRRTALGAPATADALAAYNMWHRAQ